jgi:hypothetical protein
MLAERTRPVARERNDSVGDVEAVMEDDRTAKGSRLRVKSRGAREVMGPRELRGGAIHLAGWRIMYEETSLIQSIEKEAVLFCPSRHLNWMIGTWIPN